MLDFGTSRCQRNNQIDVFASILAYKDVIRWNTNSKRSDGCMYACLFTYKHAYVVLFPVRWGPFRPGASAP